MTENCPRCGAKVPTGRLGACPRCFLSADLPPAVLGGTLELGEELGKGGMGTVYRARHLRLGRTVAVKILPEHLASNPEFRARFDREARALAMLNHPNIVAIHDIGQEEDQSYIVMEFVEGGPLSSKMPMPVEKAIDVALQVCDALSYAHKQGVIHRDIKPENILLDGGGRVKVTDFGIARIVRADATIAAVTTPDYVMGTPHFMAPEAMAGARPDPRMDIYSLGVVLYKLVTGQLPVGSFPPAPAPLDSVIRKALAPDPANRYATADEMRAALAPLLGRPISAGLPPEEKNFIWAVATLQSISTAVAIYAFKETVTPRRIPKGERRPLVVIPWRENRDGSIDTLARFETWWTLAALATFAVAITAYGLLRRHWRKDGLERNEPETPVRESKWVFFIGLASCLAYAAHLLAERHHVRWLMPYFSPLGGLILTAALFFLWVTILSAWRIARPLRREPRMWVGFAIALIPPTLQLFIEIRRLLL